MKVWLPDKTQHITLIGETKDKSKDERKQLKMKSGRITKKNIPGWRWIFEAEIIIQSDAAAVLFEEVKNSREVTFQPFDDNEYIKYYAIVEEMPQNRKFKQLGTHEGYTIHKVRFTSTHLHWDSPPVNYYTSERIPVDPGHTYLEDYSIDDVVVEI